MCRHSWVRLFGISLLGIAGASLLLAQPTGTKSCAPGPLPTIGEIQSLCVEEYPAPRDRTDIGLFEQVLCWIDPATWRDTDICTDAAGNRTEVSDTLGDVVWSVEGDGDVYPIVTDGSAVTLTGYGGKVTVVATVTDSRTLGDDPPIQRRKAFNVLVPSGVEVVPAKVQPPAKKAGDAK
jgi:hypothetical protein